MARSRITRLAAAAAVAIAAASATLAATPGAATAAPQRPPAAKASPFHIVPSPSPSPNGSSLRASTAISPTDVWAVGYDQTSPLAEHWNGSAWTVVATPTPSISNRFPTFVSVSAVSSTDVWAVGNVGGSAHDPGTGFIEHWDGRGWSIVPGPLASYSPPFTSVAAISSSNVYAVGFYGGATPSCNSYIPFVEHWNGSVWSTIATAAPTCGATLAAVSGSSASDVWVVGGAAGPQIGVAIGEHFNGRSWTLVSLPQYTNPMAVVDVSPTDAWAVGYQIVHWDGRSWKTVPSASSIGELSAVTALSATDVWAVGFTGFSFPLNTFAEHFNGKVWSVVPTPSPSGTTGAGDTLNGVSSVAGHVYAVGYTAPDNFTQKTLVLEDDKG